jgi:hypothetical protein
MRLQLLQETVILPFMNELCPVIASRHGLKSIRQSMMWNSVPPRGVLEDLHRFDIFNVIEQASAALRTDPGKMREHLVVGATWKARLMALPHFVPAADQQGMFPIEDGFTVLGKLGWRLVVFDPNDDMLNGMLLANEVEGVFISLSV